MPILEVKNVTLQFGGLKAVNNLNFEIKKNSIMSLIGPNGAGKTSVFNLITGFYKPTSGSILFNGKNIIGKKPSAITELGMARTFQNLRLFNTLDVLENVMSGPHSKTSQGILGAILRTPAQQREEAHIVEVAKSCMDFMDISQYSGRLAMNLPYGVQRHVEIARALATQPKLLLLDEPAAGLNHSEKQDLIGIIKRIREEFDLTILLIEHDIGLVKEVSEHVTVISYGEKIAEGNPEEVLNHPAVVEAYLGKEDAV